LDSHRCDPNKIFVFGSNLSGIHGAGAALHAKKYHGAINGKGIGHWGNSYAIPTRAMDLGPVPAYSKPKFLTLPLEDIAGYVYQFIIYASHHPELTFEVTRIGCGLAGRSAVVIAPMFYAAPKNCILPPTWITIEDLWEQLEDVDRPIPE
jgi:hypothetical protein